MLSHVITLAATTHAQDITAVTNPAALPLTHLTRTAAVTGYIALTLAASLGLLRGISSQRGWRVTWLLDEIHQFVALLAAALVTLHLAALALDPMLPFAPVMLLLPVGDPARPLAHALGALALYAMIIVSISSWLRRRLPYAFWLWLHTLSFVVFLAATLHGILAGNDSANPWMRAVYIASAATVALLVFARLLTPKPAAPRTATRPSPAPTSPLQ